MMSIVGGILALWVLPAQRSENIAAPTKKNAGTGARRPSSSLSFNVLKLMNLVQGDTTV